MLERGNHQHPEKAKPEAVLSLALPSMRALMGGSAVGRRSDKKAGDGRRCGWQAVEPGEDRLRWWCSGPSTAMQGWKYSWSKNYGDGDAVV
ncbi:unnamed protein product [Linum trigynum]|uniref:Uncharacterized protein n=1 Tax=Linum trigynum TaxID=586398 RepID=A0AAV2DWT8_9ROSI